MKAPHLICFSRLFWWKCIKNTIETPHRDASDGRVFGRVALELSSEHENITLINGGPPAYSRETLVVKHAVPKSSWRRHAARLIATIVSR